MRRNVIVLEKHLHPGEVGNVSAILMGQMVKKETTLFSDDTILDLNGVQHAGIKNSTIILKAGAGQILNLADSIKANPDLISVVFSATGQSLNNQFSDYQAKIKSSSTEVTRPVGIILSGEDSIIRSITKKFSVLQ